MAIKTFTAGSILTASDTNTYLNNGGLVYIGAKALSGVSTDITSVFSATYDSYRVIISGFNTATSTPRLISMRLLAGTTPASGAGSYASFRNLVYGGPTNSAEGGTSTQFEIGTSSTIAGQSIVLEFYDVFKAAPTAIRAESMFFQSNLSSFIFRQGGGSHNASTSYDGFQIYGVTDALSGTVRVYGYRQA